MANRTARIRRARQAPSKRGRKQTVGGELAAGEDRIADGATLGQKKKVAIQEMINDADAASPAIQPEAKESSNPAQEPQSTEQKTGKEGDLQGQEGAGGEATKKNEGSDAKASGEQGVPEEKKDEIVKAVIAVAKGVAGPASGGGGTADPKGGGGAEGGATEGESAEGAASEAMPGQEEEAEASPEEAKAEEEGKEGREGEGEGKEKKEEEEPDVPRSPEEDPNFIAAKGEVKTTATAQQEHGDPVLEAEAAGQAAEVATSEYLGEAQGNQVGEMDDAEPELFDAATFKAKLMERIESMQLPANEDEADDFENNNNIQEISDAASADASEEREKAAGPVEGATSKEPNTENVPEREVTPLPEAPIGEAPLAVDAKKAMPPKRPEKEVSKPLQDDADEVDAKMAEHDITEEQLEKSNEPQFTGALDKKKEGEEHVKTAAQEFRIEEEGKRIEAQESAQQASEEEIAGMHQDRSDSLNEVVGQQETGGQKNTEEREKIANDINNIYEQTKTEVETSLDSLETEVTDKFDLAAKGARVLFERHVDKRMTKYLDDRYSGWGVFNRVGDFFGGLPDEVNEFFVEGRKIYIDTLDVALTWIANHIAEKLKAAKDRIAQGKQEVADYVSNLDTSLQDIGNEVAEEVEGKFDALEEDVVARQQDLIDSLADQYNEHLKEVDARIEEMKAANRGLFDMILDAIIGVIMMIINIAKMLFKLLSAVVEAIGAILSDPIGFLSNLIDGLVQGFKNFGTNIMKHLTAGLITWLTGAMGPVGITIPDDIFSLPGIFNLVMQILGLGWDFIRKKAVRMMGEKVVQALETGYEVFTAMASNGINGLWDFIKDQFNDLKEVVMDAIKDMLITKVIEAGIKWIMGLLSPAGAFIKAAMAIIEIARFFIERGSEILELVNAFIDGIRAVASGSVAKVASAIENALARAIPIVIGFLAALLGISGLTKKVTKIIKRIRKRINKAVNKILKKAKKAGRKLFRKGKKKSGKKVKDKDVEKEVKDEKKGKKDKGDKDIKVKKWWKKKVPVRSSKEPGHKLKIVGGNRKPRIEVHSEPKSPKKVIKESELPAGEKKAALSNISFMNDALKDVRTNWIELRQVPRSRSDQRSTKNKALDSSIGVLDKKMQKVGKDISTVFDKEGFVPLPPRSTYNFQPIDGKSGYILAEHLSKKTTPQRHGTSAPVKGWEDLQNAGLTTSKDKYVKMHMINHRIGGEDRFDNFVPGHSSVNTGTKMRDFEKKVLKAARGSTEKGPQQYSVLWMTSQVHYYSDSDGAKWYQNGRRGITINGNQIQPKASNYAKSLVWKAGYYEPVGNTGSAGDWKRKPTVVFQSKFGRSELPLPEFLQSGSRADKKLFNKTSRGEMTQMGIDAGLVKNVVRRKLNRSLILAIQDAGRRFSSYQDFKNWVQTEFDNSDKVSNLFDVLDIIQNKLIF